MAYEQIEGPIDGRRGDYHAALLMQTLIALKMPKGKKAPRIEDLLIDWDAGADKAPTPGHLITKAQAANIGMGGEDKRAGKLASSTEAPL